VNIGKLSNNSTRIYEEKQYNEMDVNFVSLQQLEWPIPEWRTPETFEYPGMNWYDWQSPGYSLMTSCISVCSSKLSHSHLTVQDGTVLNNNTTEI
jgi:hypothetical protein